MILFRREHLEYPQRLKFYVVLEGSSLSPEEVTEIHNYGEYLETRSGGQWAEFQMDGRCRCSRNCLVRLMVEFMKEYPERRIVP